MSVFFAHTSPNFNDLDPHYSVGVLDRQPAVLSHHVSDFLKLSTTSNPSRNATKQLHISFISKYDPNESADDALAISS